MTELTRRFVVAAGWQPDQLHQLLPEQLQLQPGSTQRVRIAYLDTFDWRLLARNGLLTFERARGRSTVRWLAAGEHAHVVPVAAPPRFAGELPAGPMAGQLAPIIKMRALLVMGETAVDLLPLRLTDADGNTLLRLSHERVSLLDRRGRPTGTGAAVRAQGVPGHEQVFAQVVQQLAAATAGEAPLSDLAAAAAVHGRSPGDYSSKPRLALDPDQPAGDAVQVILGHLLETLRWNLSGVMHDIDSEFLHDLRVAVRRARSVLGQLRQLFVAEQVRPLQQELKWLGSITGPCRDLDVFLLEMDHYRTMVPRAAAALPPLEQHLQEQRAAAHTAVLRCLRSSRFSRLVNAWQALVNSTGSGEQAPLAANRRAREIADERIARAYRRIVRRGADLGDDPAAEPLHRLRIDAKKLRYLLELLHSLYRADRVDRLVKELKGIQDLLGGINDLEVQQRQLAEMAQSLVEQGSAPAPTIMAMGRLQAMLEQQQEQLRPAFAGRFHTFAGRRVQQRLHRLLAGPGPREQ